MGIYPSGRMDKSKTFSLYWMPFFLCFHFVMNGMGPIGVEHPHNRDLNRKITLAMQHAERYLRDGEFLEAVGNYERVFWHAKSIENHEAETESLMKLGLLWWNRGDLNRSYQAYSSAVKVAHTNELYDQKGVAETAIRIHDQYSLGKKYRESREYQKSIASFRKAIRLSKSIDSEALELKCLRQLGITYWEIYKLEDFYGCNQEALRLAKALRHSREIGKCLNNIGLYYLKRNDYQKALICHFDALEISEKFGNDLDVSASLNNIAVAYKEIGNYEKALSFFFKALKIDENLGNIVYLSKSFNNIGIVYLNQAIDQNNKEYSSKAIEYFRKSLKLAHHSDDKFTEAKALNNMANAFLFRGEYGEAKRILYDAKLIAEDLDFKELLLVLLNNLGISYLSLNDFLEAKKLFKKSIVIGTELKADHAIWEAYFGLGMCCERDHKYREACHHYEKAVAVIEGIRSQIFFDSYQAGFLNNKLEVYESYVDLLLRLDGVSGGYKHKIYEIVEKAKARSFLELLVKTKADVWDQLSPSLKKQEQELSRRITKYNRELMTFSKKKTVMEATLLKLGQAEDEYAYLISKLRDEILSMADIVLADPCTVNQIQTSILNDETALVEYFLGEKLSYVFVITSNRFDVFPLPRRDEIRKSQRAYLKVLSERPEDEFVGDRAAERIFNELLPFYEKTNLDSIEKLIIVPDGILYHLPFETLILPEKKNRVRKEFLIERFGVSYAFSSSSLYYLSTKPKNYVHSRRLLAIGDPNYSLGSNQENGSAEVNIKALTEAYKSAGFSFAPLPYTRKEIKKISGIFPKSQADVFLSNEATEEIYKALPLKEYQIIHFACHSFLDEKIPFQSALILSLYDQDSEDGFLQVREILNHQITADLVVLSACQTAKGKLLRGEGVLGLPRIFFYSGARAVLLTLWKIGDKSTSTFMEYFYDSVREGTDLAHSLKNAKIRMLSSKYSHPFYWAGFVLSGDSTSRIFPD